MAGVANPSVELHREHPRPLRPVAHEPKEGNDPVQFCTGAARLPGRLSGTLSQRRTQRPNGMPVPDDFAIVEGPLLDPRDGQVLLRGIYLSLDPYMRGRISGQRSY